MRRLLTSVVLCAVFAMQCLAQPVFGKYEYTLDYFLLKSFPDMKNGGQVTLSGKFNPAIPEPKDVLGFELGEFYAEWHAVVDYMRTLDRLSDRVSIRKVETTYEKRPIIEVIITSPENQKNIDAIRAEHLKLSDASVSQSLDVSKMPVIVSHINSIHGNEESAVNASLAVAYFFTASEDEKVLEILDNTVLLITPGINPDGINRFAAWCNSASSTGQRLCDVNSREYSSHEPWPASRTNHYWHDGNRDLILTQHPEGRAFADIACTWMPNLMYDNHEQGGTKGLYYSPGDLKRLHPLIPMEGQDVARMIGKYTASVMDSVGQKSYSETTYDDFYLGRGDVYGDIQGIINILIEQTNSRGFARPVGKSGMLDFATSVRNQSYVSMVSVFAAWQNRELLHNYQRNFFLRSAELARKASVKGYLFNTRGNKGLEYSVLEWMKNQHFDVYRLAKDTKADGVIYRAEDSYIIPAEQRYFLKFRGLWEDLKDYTVDRFYDVTTWSLKRAFNVQEAELTDVAGLIGDKVTSFTFPAGNVSAASEYGYVVAADELYYHNIIRAMLIKNVRVEIAAEPFKVGGVKYAHGTAYIPVDGQPLSAEEIHAELVAAAEMNGVDVVALKKPVKMGKTNVLTHLPRVAILTGKGFSASESGEVWYMLDRRFGLTPARIDINRAHKIKDLNIYDVIIVPNGRSGLPVNEKIYRNLKTFVEKGGVVIASGVARYVVRGSKIAEIRIKAMESKRPAAERNYGCIISSDIDTSHPLGYGYPKDVPVPVFKRGLNFFDMEASEFDTTPLVGSEVPYLSGFISQTNLELMSSRPIVVTKKVGEGMLIYSTDNLTFRSYWFSTMKLFMNSIYFGNFCRYEKP